MYQSYTLKNKYNSPLEIGGFFWSKNFYSLVSKKKRKRKEKKNKENETVVREKKRKTKIPATV